MTEVKAGFLHKCEGNGKSWKKHWMILRTNGKLIYYEKKGGQEKGSVDLIKSGHIGLTKNIDSATERLPLGIDDATAFSIVTKERTYTLYAESPADCNEWIAKLLKVRNRSDGNKGYPAPTNPTQRVRSASQPARTPGTIAGFGPPQRLPYPPPATPQPQQAVDVPTNPTQPVQPASQPAQQVQMEQAPPLPTKNVPTPNTHSPGTTAGYAGMPPQRLPSLATSQSQQASNAPTNPTQPVQPTSQPAQQVQKEQAPPLPAKNVPTPNTRSPGTTAGYVGMPRQRLPSQASNAPTNPTQPVQPTSQPAQQVQKEQAPPLPAKNVPTPNTRSPGTTAGYVGMPRQRLPSQASNAPTNPTQPIQPASQPAQQVQMEQAPPLPAKAQYTRSLNTTTSYGPPHQLPYRGPPQATPQPQQTMYRGPSPLPPYGPPTQAYRPPLAPQGYQPPPNPGYYQQPYPGYYQPAPVYRQPMPPQPVYRAPLPQRQLQQQMSSTVVVAGGITIDINQQQGIGGQRSNVVVKR